MCVGAPAGAFSEPKIATPQIFYVLNIENVCGRSRRGFFRAQNSKPPDFLCIKNRGLRGFPGPGEVSEGSQDHLPGLRDLRHGGGRAKRGFAGPMGRIKEGKGEQEGSQTPLTPKGVGG